MKTNAIYYVTIRQFNYIKQFLLTIFIMFRQHMKCHDIYSLLADNQTAAGGIDAVIKFNNTFAFIHSTFWC